MGFKINSFVIAPLIVAGLVLTQGKKAGSEAEILGYTFSDRYNKLVIGNASILCSKGGFPDGVTYNGKTLSFENATPYLAHIDQASLDFAKDKCIEEGGSEPKN